LEVWRIVVEDPTHIKIFISILWFPADYLHLYVSIL